MIKFRIIFYIAICCLLSLHMAAQNNRLQGKVLFLNSGNSPAVGVEISGSIKRDSITINANPVYSADDGSYTLVFPQAVPGHVVELKVSEKTGSGQALEIVNEEELRICRIPEDPAETFDIIVCKKGERDVAAQRYYRILKTSAERELGRMKREWSTLLDQSEKDYQKITEMSKRIDELQKQTDSLKLYKDALRIASINKDNATKRVLRYLKLLDEGTSIQEARAALSINKAIDELEVGILRFKAAVEELQTRADASQSMFDYKDAIRCYDTLINYAEKVGVDRLKMTFYYTDIGQVFFK